MHRDREADGAAFAAADVMAAWTRRRTQPRRSTAWIMSRADTTSEGDAHDAVVATSLGRLDVDRQATLDCFVQVLEEVLERLALRGAFGNDGDLSLPITARRRLLARWQAERWRGAERCWSRRATTRPRHSRSLP